MHRIPSILGVIAAACLAARADVRVNWASAANAIRQASGTNAPGTWMAQLVYAGADDQIAPLNPAAPYTPGGDDVVLLSQRLNTALTPPAGRIFTDQNLLFPGNAMVGHRVYTRVFNVDYGSTPNGGNPATLPTLYGDSLLSNPFVVLVQTDPTTVLAHTPVVQVNQTVPSLTPPGTVTIGTFPDASRRVSFTGGSGTQYYLETRTSLTSGTWSTAAGPVSGSGPLQLVIPANSPSPSYFRVRAE
jgi:hypothetical protein